MSCSLEYQFRFEPQCDSVSPHHPNQEADPPQPWGFEEVEVGVVPLMLFHCFFIGDHLKWEAVQFNESHRCC